MAGTGNCRECPQNTSRSIIVFAFVVLMAILGVLAAAAYLRTANTSATGSHVFLGDFCPPVARLLARLPPSTPRQASSSSSSSSNYQMSSTNIWPTG